MAFLGQERLEERRRLGFGRALRTDTMEGRALGCYGLLVRVSELTIIFLFLKFSSSLYQLIL